MYLITTPSQRRQTEKAEYPFCRANSLSCGNVSWIQRDELALRASTRLATEVWVGKETQTTSARSTVGAGTCSTRGGRAPTRMCVARPHVGDVAPGRADPSFAFRRPKLQPTSWPRP